MDDGEEGDEGRKAKASGSWKRDCDDCGETGEGGGGTAAVVSLPSELEERMGPYAYIIAVSSNARRGAAAAVQGEKRVCRTGAVSCRRGLSVSRLLRRGLKVSRASIVMQTSWNATGR